MNSTEKNSAALGADFLRHDTAPAGGGVEGYLEHDAAVYRTLLESTRAIPWKIAWATMEFAHIGPQIETLRGWTPSRWKTVRDWIGAQRHGGPLSLIMADIDFFKSYNDYYGHVQGDACLKQIGMVLSAAVRPGDFVGRFGGEEFVLILPNTGAEAARQVVERCRDRISAAEIAHERSPFRQTVTASFGAGTVIPS